jgi:tetratricopeptide (TPR) repeat protein
MRLIRAVAAIPVFALGLAVPAHAQQQPAERPVKEEDARARELFLEGEAHYAAGRYELAAERYLAAYELSQRPELLFNLGNAFERMGEYEKAADYLRRYAESPRARDVVSVRERVRRLEAAAAEEKRRTAQAQEDAPARVEPPVDQAPAPQPAARDDGNPAYWWLIGSGAAAVSTVVFGLLANNAGNNAAADCTETSTGRPLCRDTASSALTQETVFALGADVSAIATVVTAGVGIYLLLQGDDEKESSATATRVEPALVPSGFGVSFSGRF